MSKKQNKEGITVKKEDDVAEWYSQVCLKSDLADYGPVKGTMIIKPRGYAIWEKIQNYFNEVLTNRKIENAYFPLFIPESFFKKEAEHAKGFNPEVAWIISKTEGERLALRPTSETIIYDSYSKWIRSWRDLPLRINQWCNIVRWEVSDCKLFIRSREFLWQEGHCVYETEKQCKKEVLEILDEYEKLCNDLLALPVLKGIKTQKEKFAGAKDTVTIEAFMPDGKALQCGTSHNLGQGFAKSFGINYRDKNEKKQIPWQNSWGISTRLIGATVMTHSDNKGLVLPPKIAPTQIVIVPIFFKNKDKKKILKIANEIKNKLKKYSVDIDGREEYTPGWKFNEWELKGVPIRIEIGPKDIQKKQVVLVRRDTNNKQVIKINVVDKKIDKILKEIQDSLFKKAKRFLQSNIKKTTKWNDFLKIIKNKQIALAPFCEDISCEDEIKSKSGGAGSRLIPFGKSAQVRNEKCVRCNKKAKFWVYFSRSY